VGCASRFGPVEIVKLLLGAGAPPNVADSKFGLTPLHLAAINGQRNIAEMLIARGAGLNARDKSGHTPLSWAMEKNQPALVELLKHHGAQP